MKRSALRRSFKEVFNFFFKEPKKHWQATVRLWDKGIVLGWSFLVWLSASVTNNMGTLLLLLWMGIGMFIIFYYFIAKGK